MNSDMSCSKSVSGSRRQTVMRVRWRNYQLDLELDGMYHRPIVKATGINKPYWWLEKAIIKDATESSIMQHKNTSTRSMEVGGYHI